MQIFSAHYNSVFNILTLSPLFTDSKKEKQGGRMGAMGPGGMQDPINALQNLTKTGMGHAGPQGRRKQPRLGLRDQYFLELAINITYLCWCPCEI